MKTADEIYKQMVDMMPFKEPSNEVKNYILEAMRIFANEACIEQRRLCFENIKHLEIENEFYVEEVCLDAILAVTP